MIKKIFIKTISLLLVIGLNWAGISAIGSTWAYFNDTETSEGNSMAAGVLDFTLDLESDFAPEVNLGQDSERTIKVEDTASTMDYNYKVKVDNAVNIPLGDLCGYLYLKDNVSGALQQPLVSFVSGEVLYPSVSEWTFTASLNTPPNSGWEGKTCKFDFIYEGWQDNIVFGAGGFSDVERIGNVITAGQAGEHLLITKVYYDVDGAHGSEGDNEWVEIYNVTNTPVDLTSWEICDNNSCDTLPNSNIIPAAGFAIITNKNTTWDYWSIPNDVIKIELNNLIGGGLANVGDRVILKNADAEEVDAMSYGNNISVFNLSSLGVGEGYMFARVPVGQDTDMAADWQKISLPQVSGVAVSPLQSEHCGHCGSNPDEYCAQGLYYSQQLNIVWNATTSNTSGNSGLSIDIVYIADNDCSGDISDGDNRYVIKKDEANDGSYTWAGWTGSWNGTLWKDENGNIIPYFYGYAWIEITAAGPENFMVNNSKISIPMFEPLPPGIDFEDLCSAFGICDACHSESEDYFETNNSVVNESSDDNASDDNIDAGIEQDGSTQEYGANVDDDDSNNASTDSSDKDVISGDSDNISADSGNEHTPNPSQEGNNNPNSSSQEEGNDDGDESDIIQTASLKDEDIGGFVSDDEIDDNTDDNTDVGIEQDGSTREYGASDGSDSGNQGNEADDSDNISADNDMPIKSDDDSTEIIFSI